jgi:CheY-like chemotaxis protein
MKKSSWFKTIISAIAILLAVLRFVFFDTISSRMDSTFLLLVGIAVVIFIIPWEKITTFKGWGVELTLDKPQVKGALEGTGLTNLKRTPLWEKLSHLESEIENAKGSRVLWIDDHPHEVLSERRVLRALGIDVITASSSMKAEGILEEDDDFDLIISDVQRKGRLKNQATRYGGIYFIKELREKYLDSPGIKALPVIFYSAYQPDQIEKIKRQVGETFLEEIRFCGSFDTLLPEVITILAKVRSNPVTVRPKKKATDIT